MRLQHLHLCSLILVLIYGASAQGGAAPQAPGASAVAANVPLEGVVDVPKNTLPGSALGEQPIRPPASQDAASPSAPSSVAPSGMDYPRVLAALGIVVGLILVLRWLGKFFFPAASGRGASRAIEVLSRSPVSPKQQVMLIRVGRRLVLVGDSGSQMNPLCEINDPDEIAALVGQLRDDKVTPTTRAFGAMFKRSRKDFERPDESPATEERPASFMETEEDRPVDSAREELNGLRDRVRLLAQQFRDSA